MQELECVFTHSAFFFDTQYYYTGCQGSILHCVGIEKNYFIGKFDVLCINGIKVSCG